MVAWASAAAVLLYLLPAAVVLWHRRDRELLELAQSIPLAVAADLLTLFAAMLAVRLEVAVIASRVAWLAGGLALAWVRRARDPARSSALSPRAQLAIALCALGMVVLSVALSRPYAIWDRMWHAPLVASLRGQGLPFANVFEPGRVLHYHFSGNVLAAALQVLSGATIHASRALSLAHDLMFGLMGASLALLLRGCGRGLLASVLLAWAVALAGPFSLIPLDARYPYWGYSIHAFLTLSYRPHTSIFGLLTVGVCAVLLDRARPRPAALIALFALMGITDEFSSALLLFALGVAWLAEPALLHGKRSRGLGVLVLAGLAILLANLLFRASLAPGGPASALELVAPRAPGFGHPSLPLTSAKGALALFLDLAPTLACLAALLVRGLRRRAGLAWLSLALVAVGVFGLTSVQINGAPVESHRFMSAAVFVVALLAFTQATGRADRLLAGVGGALAAVSTLVWAAVGHPRASRYYLDKGNYAVDCRQEVGAHLLERPVPTYVSPAIWESYSGCRPLYAAGLPASNQWGISLGPLLGPDALAAVAAQPPQQGPLPIACRRGDPDPICAAARASAPCQPAGQTAERCLRPRE